MLCLPFRQQNKSIQVQPKMPRLMAMSLLTLYLTKAHPSTGGRTTNTYIRKTLLRNDSFFETFTFLYHAHRNTSGVCPRG